MKQVLPAAALFVPLVLLCDGSSIARQLFLGIATAVFLMITLSHTRIDPRAVVCAVCLATAGEVFASILWGLYSYRFTTLIPLYVPFGRVNFFNRPPRSYSMVVCRLAQSVTLVKRFRLSKT